MSGCLTCGANVPEGKDWCSRRCRKALRSLGIALLPFASRREQLDKALAHRRAGNAVGLGMPTTFRHPPRQRVVR